MLLDDWEMCREIENRILADILKASSIFSSLADFFDAVKDTVRH
jgi:hypothetical protein